MMGNVISLQEHAEDKRLARKRFLQTLVAISGVQTLEVLGTAAYNCESHRLTIPLRVYERICHEVGYAVDFVELDRGPWPRRISIKPRKGDTGRSLSPRGQQTTKTLSLRRFRIRPTPNKRLACLWDASQKWLLLDYGISSGRTKIHEGGNQPGLRRLYATRLEELLRTQDEPKRERLREQLRSLSSLISRNIEELEPY